MSNYIGFAVGEWNHLFCVGSKETRCRIVIDLEQSKLIAAQEWTGLKFEDVRGDRLKDLAKSVIEVNEAHAALDDWNLELTSELPAWADQREVSNYIEQSAEPQDRVGAPKGALGQIAVKAFPDRKGEVFRDKVRAITRGMTPEDLDILKNDRMGSFEFPHMPSVLAEYFYDWHRDSGRGELGLSHENIHETYASFYEHIVGHPEDWDKEQVAMALAMLETGEVGPTRVEYSVPTP